MMKLSAGAGPRAARRADVPTSNSWYVGSLLPPRASPASAPPPCGPSAHVHLLPPRSFFSSHLEDKAGPSGLREGADFRYLSTKPHVQPAGKAPKDWVWGSGDTGHPRVGVIVGAPNPYKGKATTKHYSGDLAGSWTMHLGVFWESHQIAGQTLRKPLDMFDVYNSHTDHLHVTGPVLDMQRFEANADVLTFTVLSDMRPEDWTARGVKVSVLCNPGESVCKPEHLGQVGR